MKNLQTPIDEKWRFTSLAELSGVIRRAESPKEVFLLLHGLGERGRRTYRKLVSYLPQDSLIISPNGPFPISRLKDGKIDYGHSWYFYDKQERKYYVTQDLSKFWLRDLLKIENPQKKPVTIIGFSQGGYLAPLAGMVIPETKLVLGIACEFRTTLIHEKMPFPLVAIHGEKDEVVPMKDALSESEKLSPLGINVDFHKVPEAGHEITKEMGELIRKILESYGKRSL